MASRWRNICQKLYLFVSSSNSYCPCYFTTLSSIPDKEHTSPTLLPCPPNSPNTWFYLPSEEARQGTVPASCHCSYGRSLHPDSYRSCCSAQPQVTTTAHPHLIFNVGWLVPRPQQCPPTHREMLPPDILLPSPLFSLFSTGQHCRQKSLPESTGVLHKT